MTVKLGIYAMFLLKMVVQDVYFKNLTGATLVPLGNFSDVISHAHFFTYLLIMTYLVCGINISCLVSS